MTNKVQVVFYFNYGMLNDFENPVRYGSTVIKKRFDYKRANYMTGEIQPYYIQDESALVQYV